MTGPVDTVRTDRLAGGYSGRILVLIAFCTFVGNLGWLVLPPVLPAIVDDLNISGTQAGFAITMLTALSALGRYPGGRLADKLSRKTVLGLSLCLWFVGFSLVFATQNYPTFLLGVAFVGFGLGAYVPAAFANLSDVFEHKQGRAFGLNNAASNLGGIVASALALVVLAAGSWRLAFLPVVVLVVPLLVLLHVWSSERYVVHRIELDVSVTANRILLDSRILTFLVVASLFSFSWNGAVAFLPTFLDAERGLTTTLASVSYASIFVLGVVTTPIAGAVGDRFGSLRAVFLSLCFAILGLGVVLTAPGTAVVLGGVVLFAIGLTGFWPVMTAYMMTSFPEGSKAGDYGAIGTVYMGAGSVGPTFVGSLGEYLHFTAAYAGVGVCLVFCLALVFWMDHYSSL